jgi:hypothetical protein
VPIGELKPFCSHWRSFEPEIFLRTSRWPRRQKPADRRRGSQPGALADVAPRILSTDYCLLNSAGEARERGVDRTRLPRPSQAIDSLFPPRRCRAELGMIPFGEFTIWPLMRKSERTGKGCQSSRRKGLSCGNTVENEHVVTDGGRVLGVDRTRLPRPSQAIDSLFPPGAVEQN